MCCGCWQRHYDAPTLETPVVWAMAALLSGQWDDPDLHIVLEDWNLEDDDLEEALDACVEPASRAILEALRAMSREERASAAGLAWGCFDPRDLATILRLLRDCGWGLTGTDQDGNPA